MKTKNTKTVRNQVNHLLWKWRPLGLGSALVWLALLCLGLVPSARGALGNDLCAGARALTTGTPITEDTTYATSTGDPAGLCGALAKGIWFTFTPTVNGPVLIETCGSDFDTILQVYTGTCAALAPVACVDNAGPACASLQASVSFVGTAGMAYRIFVGGSSGASGRLEIVALDGSVPTYSISGQVSDGVTGVSGVRVSVDSRSVLTSGAGHYTLLNLPGGTYTVAPEACGVGYAPPNRSVTLGPSVAGVDFVGNRVRIDSIVRVNPTTVRIDFTGLCYRSYTVLGHTDVTAPLSTWSIVATVATGSDGRATVDIPIGTTPYRFFTTRTP